MDIPRLLEPLKKGEADLVLVLLDSDGQHDPDEIPVLIKPISEDGYDLATGSRKLKGKGFSVEAEMIYLAEKHGLKTIEVPITEIYVEDGSTLNPWIW